MRISRTAYDLDLTRDPFTITLSREGRVLLTTAPHAAPATSWRAEGDTVTVAFPAAQLTLTLHGASVTLRWEGEAPARMAFPLSEPWYGQGEFLNRRWPLNGAMFHESELITADNGPSGLLCIQSPIWLSASGVAILARSPVRVGINQPPAGYPRFEWDLGPGQAPFGRRPPADPGGAGDGHLTLAGHALACEILVAGDLPAVHRELVARVGCPSGTPPAALFARPTWTTWARYKTEVSQERVLGFAREIVDHGYPYHVLEIDDRWQVHYGDLGFDPERFPDPRGMVDALHGMGFRVTAWVIPFLDPKSAAFAECAARGYLVRTPEGEPYRVPWWQGRGGLLDVTHRGALDWFGARLRALQERSGLDGFKFDAGEAIFLPPDAVTHEPLESRNDYSRRYVEFVAEHYALTEVRTGWFNQRAPIFFRIWDLTSNWGRANGLRAVIPTALTLSLTGYPFVLPDMIGGNAYGEPPDAELLIRWTQLNALLPAMQFSLTPWSYGPECDALCRRYAALHERFAPLLVRLAEEAVRTGEPIVRPLFWAAPDDPRALHCDDQFLIGDDLLVAPVVHAGQRARDVLLPPGRWRAWEGDEIFEGPALLADYPAPLDALPLFERA